MKLRAALLAGSLALFLSPALPNGVGAEEGEGKKKHEAGEETEKGRLDAFEEEATEEKRVHKHSEDPCWEDDYQDLAFFDATSLFADLSSARARRSASAKGAPAIRAGIITFSRAVNSLSR